VGTLDAGDDVRLITMRTITISWWWSWIAIAVCRRCETARAA